jgi:hypothetical protein
MGGIETYMVRLAKHLHKHVHVKIIICSNKYNDELLKEASKYASIYFLHKYLVPSFLTKSTFVTRIPFLFPLNYENLLFDIDKVDYIHATGSESLIIANNMLKYDKNIKISLGIYHSKELTWNSYTYFRKIEKNIFLELNNKNILSCNESTSSILESFYKKKFKLPIIPIGVEVANNQSSIFNSKSNKIVSIGRLIEFKTYNEHIINIIDKINDSHDSYEYHIYGYGPNEAKLKKLASTKKSKIIFHGILEYSKIKEVLSDCFIFVGSGTTIIESSSFGIPSLIGIESNKKSETYGYFSDLVGFSYNEDNLNIEKIKLLDEITRLLSMTHIEISTISKKHIDKSKEFAIDTTSSLFLNGLENLQKNKYYSYNYFRYKISYFIWLTLNKLNIIYEMKNRYVK